MIRDPKAVYERAMHQNSEAAASAGGATDLVEGRVTR